MKQRFGTILLCAGLVCGCSDSEIHVDKVRTAFQNLPPEQKATLEEGLGDISSNNYAAAVKPLRSLALNAKLDKDQIKILNDTMKKVLTKVSEKK